MAGGGGSVRTLAIEVLGPTRSGRSVSSLGGNALLTTDQHALDGSEHTGQLPIGRLSTTDTDATKVVRPDGTGGITVGVENSLTVKDEGTPLATGATSLDFVGAGVVASGTGAAKTITISGVPAGAAGGELAGSFPNPTVASVHAGSAHHANANDPTSDEKAALAGTTGSPGNTNRYVTDTDSRLSGGGSSSGASNVTNAGAAVYAYTTFR